MVEEDPQADFSGIGDDFVEDLKSVKALQVGILTEVDAIGRAARVEQLVGYWKSNGVEASLFHLVHHFLIATRPKSVRREIGAFHAEPVHARKANHLPIRVYNLVSGSFEIPGGNARCRTARENRGIRY